MIELVRVFDRAGSTRTGEMTWGMSENYPAWMSPVLVERTSLIHWQDESL